MKVTAVVVTYNRKQLLMECLEAILNQSYKVSKIVLIDNNSTDGTYEELVKNKFIDNPLIKYIKLEKNIGGSGGFYEGMKIANKEKCDWIWIMDDDTIPRNDCLEKLVDSQKNINEKIGFLASSIYGEKNEVMNVPTIDTTPSENGYSNWYVYLDKGIVKIKTATFVSILINAEAINKIGYPVKDYFIWGDDTEYTLRINKFFAQGFMIGNSVAIHKRKNARELTIDEEDNKNRLNMFFYMIRNSLINEKAYYGSAKAIKKLIKNNLLKVKILFKKTCKHKLKKIFIITKGDLAFIFGKYDKKAFKNRLDKKVVYKK